MLWSLVKILIFIALVAGLTLGAGQLIDSGEELRVAAGGWEFTFEPLQAMIAAIVLLIVVWLVLRALGLIFAVMKFISGDETAVSRYFTRSRERKGYQALSEGMLALASGEGRLAMSKAAKAERFLSRPELTNLLTAQAAEMQGDSKKAAEVYKRLLGNDQTRFVGIRGLMRQRLVEGDTDTAMKLSEKAFALKPRHEEVQDTLLKLQADSGDWKGARATLGAKLKQGKLPRDVHRRRDAVLALQQAREVFEEGATIEAREAAIAANRASPDLIPAAVLAARGLADNGKARQAERVLKKAWEAQPHPELAAAFAALSPEESPAERLKRFEPLLKVQPDHEETQLLRAELNLAAEDFPAARRALGDLAETHPTARTLTIMAAIARGEGADDSEVRGWLTRALTASRGPQWCCDTCHNIQADWAPVCDSCGGFDTLTWREPPGGGAPLPNGAEMLPLIVGAPEVSELPEVEETEEDAPVEPTGAPNDATGTGEDTDEDAGGENKVARAGELAGEPEAVALARGVQPEK